ncbi:hypothetical protein ACFSC4_29875 [Deinococcus malanensis]|uniref:hypothetical protein n=1 Tax=Deinococcus malanensis TaxID=1706855 RepID=UPI00362B1E64
MFCGGTRGWRTGGVRDAPALTLDLEQLGEAMLEAIQAPQEHSELSMAAAAELLTRLQPFLPHDSATRALLGDELIEQLTGLPASAPTTGEAAARLAAVTGVCQLLTGGTPRLGCDAGGHAPGGS